MKSLIELEIIKGNVQPKKKRFNYILMVMVALFLVGVVVWLLRHFSKPRTALISSDELSSMIDL